MRHDAAAFLVLPSLALDLATGAQHACMVDRDGVAWCWGSNSFGQLGTDDPLPSTCSALGGRSTDCVAEPVAVEGGLTWSMLSLDAEYACGLTTDGVPYCWGSNTWGNLGDGTTTNHAIPAPVLLPSASARAAVVGAIAWTAQTIGTQSFERQARAR